MNIGKCNTFKLQVQLDPGLTLSDWLEIPFILYTHTGQVWLIFDILKMKMKEHPTIRGANAGKNFVAGGFWINVKRSYMNLFYL